MREWRLIPYQCFDGAMNMAIDEAILESHIIGAAPPTVRLYGWNPAAVSVGYSQKFSEAAVERIVALGMDVVRRPTGGRAVLHSDEFTYSFVGSSISPDTANGGFLEPSILGAYREICHGLILALQQLGVNAELGQSDSSYKQVHDCFLATTTADLHYQGKKMVGSAQCRRGPGVLQHGSILLNQPQHSMNELLTGTETKDLAIRHANLFEILNRAASIEELQNAIKTGFQLAFEVELIESQLTDAEMEHSKTLRPKYLISQSACVS